MATKRQPSSSGSALFRHLIEYDGKSRQKYLSTPIFRVFNIQRFLELCAAKKNTLVRPHKWDDPFENFILKKALELPNPTASGMTEGQENFYGQCWTSLKESDAMWRIYSSDKSGVKVKTTIGRLIESLAAVSAPNDDYFIGNVSYLKDSVLRDNLQKVRWLMAEVTDIESMARSLLFKRVEFEHEREIRLIYFWRNATTDIFQYAVNPLQLFEEVQFDPRISPELFAVYQHYLVSEIGFPRNKISKSTLYQLPTLKLQRQ